jgi:hypothetical protein
MSATVTVIVSPSLDADGRRAYGSRGPLFDAAVDARNIVTRSATPMLDAARVLAGEGMDPATRLVMRHAGSDLDAVITTVGYAAGLAIREDNGPPEFTRYRAREFRTDSPPMRPAESSATTPQEAA